MLSLLCSCVRNEIAPFEKAMEEIYGAKVEYDEDLHDLVKQEHGDDDYNYRMDFDNFKDMIIAFYQLAVKIDSIMSHDYPSHTSYPGLYKLKDSWMTSAPQTYCHWMDDSKFSVLMDFNTSAADNKNYITLSILKENSSHSAEDGK